MSRVPPDKDRRNPDRFDRRQSVPVAGHLELLSKMSGNLAITLNIDETIKKTLELIVQFVKAQAGSLFLLEDNSSILTCKASTGSVDLQGITLKAGEGIVGQCVASNTSRMVWNVEKDPNFFSSIDTATGFKTRSILCAPMAVNGVGIGAIELVNKASDDELFSDADLMMLKTLASAAALAINNAHMVKDLIGKERISRELEMASEMQRSLLPKHRPLPFPVCGVNLPAFEMSGDFYDFFELNDGRIYFCIGDVSGKGMDAALLMSKTASLFRCLGKTVHEPDVLLSTINCELCETTIHGMFVSMACGILDPATYDVYLANAGHEPPQIYCQDGTFLLLEASVPPLGIIPLEHGEKGITCETFNIKGRTLYIFTDGVTEGKLENGNRLQVSGFQSMIRKHANRPAMERLDTVVAILRDTGHKRHDDITLIAIDGTCDDLDKETEEHHDSMIVRHTFHTHIDALDEVRHVVDQACKSCGCNQELTTDIIIAIGEAYQSVIRHTSQMYRQAHNDIENIPQK